MSLEQRADEYHDLWAHPVSDEDIRWAAQLLDLRMDGFFGQDGTDPRLNVLKCMETIDVAACPGSGKTTALVAKLAILAEKWSHRTRGICVLSHTNVARREIEVRLGNTSAGRALLSYPHYIGTIHGFVNEFLAVPWLRSIPYPIRLIDSRLCEARRWSLIPHNSRYALTQRHLEAGSIRIADVDFTPTKKGGNFPFAAHTQTFSDMQNACRQSALEGFHCHEDMFIWANALLDTRPLVAAAIRDRFPFLFIDEAQDNSEDQSRIIQRIFMDEPSSVVRQRFGDANQAIFGFVGQEGAQTDPFPNEGIKQDLPNSHRFGQKIADLADPLGLNPCGLAGHGPKRQLASGLNDAPHTIFLCTDEQIGDLFRNYAELLLETFSDNELREGSFVAVGQVHKEGGDDHRPRHVGHYWPEYDPELAGINPTPRTFVQHVLTGQAASASIGETFPAAEKIVQGLLRLAATAPGTSDTRAHRQSHRQVLEMLDRDPPSRSCYTLLLSRLAVRRRELTRQAWEGRWRDVVRRIAQCIAGCELSSSEADAFLAWPADMDVQAAGPGGDGTRDNVYRYSANDRDVAIRCGSIHSVKGETHTAVLVAETYWHDHNLESIKEWLLGDCSGASGKGVRILSRLKLHYVAMTRPTHLVCLAMKKSTFSNNQGELDAAAVQKLVARGWRIKEL